MLFLNHRRILFACELAQISAIPLIVIRNVCLSCLENHVIQGCADGGVGTSGPLPNSLKIARKMVKNQPRCKRNGHSIFGDLFVVEVVVQMVKAPSPKFKVFLYFSDAVMLSSESGRSFLC